MFVQKTERRVALLCAEGLEECEALVTYDILYRAGIPTDRVAVGSGLTVTSSHGVPLACDRSIEDAGFSFDAYHMLVLPGGMPGTTNLACCEGLAEALRSFAAAGRPLAAICAAPTVLAGLGLLEGRRATCYPDMQHLLAEGGAVVCAGDEVVTDGIFTTSQSLGTAVPFGLALVERILGEDASAAIREQIAYAH